MTRKHGEPPKIHLHTNNYFHSYCGKEIRGKDAPLSTFEEAKVTCKRCRQKLQGKQKEKPHAT